jgi:DNA-binding response OmpR family regulator
LLGLAEHIRSIAAQIEILAGEPPMGDRRLRIELRKMEVTWRGDPVYGLSRRQILIVEYLSRHPGVIRSRHELMDYAEFSEEREFRVVDVHMRRIRRAFETVDARFNSIHTVYGAGYYWKVEE